ncbi:MAG: hypothetical protein ABH821_03305, partial [archaeon]
RKVSESYSVKSFLTCNDSERVSVAVSEGANYNETTKNSSDRVYYVLGGELTINDSLKAGKGDLVFISGGTEYNFKGTFKAVLINSPAFNKENEETRKA